MVLAALGAPDRGRSVDRPRCYIPPPVDRRAFEKLAMGHLDAVFRMALQLARNEADATDLVQETYLRALRASDRFEERAGGVRAWLFRILHNVFFSEVERTRRRPIAMEGAGERDPDPGAAPDEAQPAWDLASLNWEHVDERIKGAIGRLRPEFREVLLLWAVEGLKYREISEIVEVPIGTVMSRLHRARATLAGDLREFREERRLPDGS